MRAIIVAVAAGASAAVAGALALAHLRALGSIQLGRLSMKKFLVISSVTLGVLLCLIGIVANDAATSRTGAGQLASEGDGIDGK